MNCLKNPKEIYVYIFTQIKKGKSNKQIMKSVKKKWPLFILFNFQLNTYRNLKKSFIETVAICTAGFVLVPIINSFLIAALIPVENNLSLLENAGILFKATFTPIMIAGLLAFYFAFFLVYSLIIYSLSRLKDSI